MITNINEFKKFINEEVNPDINSDKSVRLQDYENDMEYYKQNISKLESITGTDPKNWEEEASKIIQTNKYLGHHWKITKMEKKSKDVEERLKESELSEEEKKNLKIELDGIDADKILAKRKLDEDIKEDIKTIEKM